MNLSSLLIKKLDIWSCCNLFPKLNDGHEMDRGCTHNLIDRLDRHSRGSVPATKNRRPVSLISYIVFHDKYKAFAFEKYLKTGSGRAFLNKRLI